MAHRTLLFAILLIAGLAVACGSESEPASSTSLEAALERGGAAAEVVDDEGGDLVANTGAAVEATEAKPQVFWIHTSWCTNCKKLEPTWEELVASHGGAIEMIVVDRDSKEGKAFARSHGINYQPGFVIYDSTGELVYEGLGPYAPDELEALVLNLE